jgi:hypothetical protein
MISPKKSEARLTTILNAWQALRPDKSFYGTTLVEFKAQVQPCLDTRATIASLENQLIAAQNQRDDADKAAIELSSHVVNAVKADPNEGEDGELYEAMGFVRKSERKSGLSRGKRPAATT